MSDSRTHVEIEDVLSSIRRLVSQEGVPPRRTGLFRAAESPFRAPNLDSAPAPVAPETLVLTPALRVSAPAPEATPAPDEAAPVAAEPAFPSAPDQPDPGADRGEAENYVEDAIDAADRPGDAAEGWQLGAGALSLETAHEARLAEHEAEEATESGLVFPPDWQMPTPAAASVAPDLRDELSRLESTIAELEAAVAASDEPFELERGDPFAGAAASRTLAAAFAAPSPEAASELIEPLLAETGAAAPEAAAPEDVLPEVAESDLPVPEAAAPDFSAREPEPESELVAEAAPTPETPADPAPEVMEWVDPLDPAEAELTASDWAEEEPEAVLAAAALAEAAKPRRLHLADAQPEPIRAAPPRSSYAEMQAEAEKDLFDADKAGLLSEPEDLIDEDALRAMVSEIIRQELQGTLGERITRSVRKLVRREIARTLASRDFE